MAIRMGCTIQPCCTYNEDDINSPSLDKNGNQKHDPKNGKPLYKQKYSFLAQQLILCDIDNGDKQRLPDSEYMTLDRIGEILQENDLAGAIVYHSFSSKPEWEKFRVGILLDEPVTDLEERNKCVLAVFKLFGMATDEKCTNIDRIFFGSTPNSVLFDDGCTVSKQVLLKLYDKLYKPELDAQATLDGNQSEDITTEKPLNNTFIPPTAPTSEGGAMEWDGEIQAPTSQRGNSSMHSDGIDTTLSPEYKPEDLLSMIDVNALDYGEWFSVSSAYKGMGGNREVWVQWNSGWNGENGKGTNRTADANSWNGANGTPSKGTLIYYAKLHSPQRYEDYKQAMNPYSKKYRTSSGHDGNQSNKEQAQQQHKKYVSPYDVDGTGRLTIANLQAYMQVKGYSVAYDEIQRDNVYFAQNPEAKLHLPETMPTLIENDLQSELRGANAEKISRYLDTLASKNYINPIRTMIENAQWDGIDRLKQLYDLFEIPETDTLSRLLIRKWCMQCIAGLYNTYESPFSLDIVLVFQGKQGISKTRFFEHLAMIPDYFKEACVLDPANKDSVMECTSVWIAELGEIGSTMRKDVDRLKGFLSQARDHYRQPYGRKALKYPRRTSFVGTVNDGKFLLDETGNRRFATVPLTIDHTIDYETQIKPFNALQFWAQILQIVRDAIAQGATMGGCFRLTEEEKAQLEGRNVTRLKPLKFEQEFLDTIQKYSEMPSQEVEWKFTTLVEWKAWQLQLEGCRVENLGKICTKYNYEKVRTKYGYKYKLPFSKHQIPKDGKEHLMV